MKAILPLSLAFLLLAPLPASAQSLDATKQLKARTLCTDMLDCEDVLRDHHFAAGIVVDCAKAWSNEPLTPAKHNARVACNQFFKKLKSVLPTTALR